VRLELYQLFPYFAGIDLIKYLNTNNSYQMKQILHVLFLLLFSFAILAQNGFRNTEVYTDSSSKQLTHRAKQPKTTIYPNPATTFISIANDESVGRVQIYNLVGRRMKSFNIIAEGQRYDIADLPQGMYLVQVMDKSNKIMTTLRITKR